MRELAQRVLNCIQRHELIKPGDRIGLAVSGGADSVAALRLMLELRGELGVALCVIHFNHHLRGAESDEDEQFVRTLAVKHKLRFQGSGHDVKAYAGKHHLSTEAAARHLRYEYFEQLIGEGAVNRVATAHTLDDQAETVLLRVVRGAGTAGLAGIYPSVAIAGTEASIIRPLLCLRRNEIEAYLRELQQPWREDVSNRDLRHARNRVRHGIIPRLARNLNPAVRESLADVAEIARVEEEYWASEVRKIMPRVLCGESAALKLEQFCTLPLALKRRLVRAAAHRCGLRLEFRHVEDVLAVCAGAKTTTALPKGWSAIRQDDQVRFEIGEESISDYEHAIGVPGSVDVQALGSSFEALLISDLSGYPAEHLFDAALLDKELVVRNWRAGDRFWPAHSKAPKKIKELLQERHITGSQRKLWPVVVSSDEVLWMRGFPRPQAWQCKPGATRAVLIREVAQGPSPQAYDSDRES